MVDGSRDEVSVVSSQRCNVVGHDIYMLCTLISEVGYLLSQQVLAKSIFSGIIGPDELWENWGDSPAQRPSY